MEVIQLDKLSIFERLIDVEEREHSAIRGVLKCVCGNEHFKMFFFGKRTKGILAPDIVRLKGKISILAFCDQCEKAYGFDNFNQSHIMFNEQSRLTNELSQYDNVNHKARYSFNYFPEKFKSNHFEYLRVEILQEATQKWQLIVEE